MIILNLGCGTKTSMHPSVINIDWSMMLRIKKSWFLKLISPIILNKERIESFKKLQSKIIVHDLSRGIPFENNSVDVVYNSHFLEHLDRDVCIGFLIEVKRVLKPGGIHRVVVPNMEYLCRKYIMHIDQCLNNDSSDKINEHDDFISAIIEQSVRRESFGTSRQKVFRRYLENIILGDARKRGETHQWMYDRISLTQKLLSTGFQEIHIQKYNSSLIHEWNEIGLDLDENGNEYKRDSLYVEAVV